MRGLFERDPAGKLLELVAADDEEGVLAVQVAQSSLDGDDSIEAARRGGPMGAQKLNELPAADLYAAVYRRVGGCVAPIITRFGIGGR